VPYMFSALPPSTTAIAVKIMSTSTHTTATQTGAGTRIWSADDDGICVPLRLYHTILARHGRK
jgi:hypothetical protein